MNRKDIVYMADWIVTVPKNVPQEDHKKIFELTFQFLENQYGRKNVVSAWVHNDEATPHIHFSFIPVIVEDGIEKLNCKMCIRDSTYNLSFLNFILVTTLFHKKTKTKISKK